MKKILTLISIAAAGAMMASCDINKLPTFDDKDAFAAFPTPSISVREDVGSLQIPVHVTSLNGVATTISYEFVNGSAKQGVDFEETGGNGTLSFSAGESEKYITVNILSRLGDYTGDLSFSVRFKSAGEVAMGASRTCTVTINDIDHPLSSILGTYTADGESYFNGPATWTMTLIKDPEDDRKVWIDNVFGNAGWAGDDMLFYGIVDEDMTNIAVPLGQAAEYKYNGADVLLLGYDEETDDVLDAGTMNIAIKDGGATLEFLDYGPSLYIDGAGFVNILYGGFTCKKD